MGLYGDKILPRIINAECGDTRTEPLRRRVCAGLAGEVVEIGFGSGLNVPFYPPAVARVAAIEPSALGWNLAARRIAKASVPVHRAGRDGQSLPLADHSHDAALSTWTLCTITDAGAALRELRRVLRPGATLHFLEHGLAPDEEVRRRQRRLDPVHRRLGGGCRITRPISGLVAAAGFTITELEAFYQDGVSKATGALVLGTALAPACAAPGGEGETDRQRCPCG